MTKQLFAVFTGTLAEGFHIEKIEGDKEAAETAVIAFLANGTLAETMEVQKPSTRGKREKDYDEGENFLVFDGGLGNGFSVYGPFPDDELASDFGEKYRVEDAEWEIFTYDGAIPR